MRKKTWPRRIANAVVRLRRCWQMDARLLLRAVGWRLALPVLKHVVPLPTLVHLMCPAPRRTPRTRLESVSFLLAHGGRIAFSTNCLDRSLALYRFLTEAGARPRLVMGVTAGAAAVSGHAWIEVDGLPLADTTTPNYAPVLAFGANGRQHPIAGSCG
jgi:hypothetical protein